MRQDVLDHFVSELSQSSPRTRNARAYYARMFLEFAGDRPLSEWNKDLVNGWLEQLRREKYAQGTVRQAYSIAKRVYDAARAVCDSDRASVINSVDTSDPMAIAQLVKAISLPSPTWDFGKRSAPKVEKENKPTLAMDQMEAMITAAKENGQPDHLAFLALASVYGLRREDLFRVRPEHIKDGAIFMDTSKGGEKRDQLLAPELMPYLEGYDFPCRSLSTLTAIYFRIEYQAGLRHEYGAGWHSLRRLVDTLLVSIHGQLTTHIFMRWKISASSDMTERYYSEETLELDHRVLADHPILELWRQ